MTPTALVADLRARGVTLEARGADGLAVRPTTLVTQAELEMLRRHKAEVLALLTAVPSRPVSEPAAAPVRSVRWWMHPWPDSLIGLGERTVGPFEAMTPNSSLSDEILGRALAFRDHVRVWVDSGRCVAPAVGDPDPLTTRADCCVSCGRELSPPSSWRCPLCREALVLALGAD